MRLVFPSLLLLLLSISVWGEMDNCGISNRPSNETDKLSRILGGNSPPLGKWPWQVELISDVLNKPRYINTCGGSIIADRWILTAAHCFGPTKKLRYVTIGSVQHYDVNKGVSAKNIIVHEEWDDDDLKLNDIALIELNKTISFDETASPICLPSINTTIPDDAQVIATGFGGTNNRTNPLQEITAGSPVLQETVIPLVPINVCRDRWHEPTLPDTQICGGSYGHGMAPGDSGGPLVIYSESGRWFQVGLASYTSPYKMHQDVRPGAYTNVQKYCDWIAEKTRGEAKCRDGGELIDATSA